MVRPPPKPTLKNVLPPPPLTFRYPLPPPTMRTMFVQVQMLCPLLLDPFWNYQVKLNLYLWKGPLIFPNLESNWAKHFGRFSISAANCAKFPKFEVKFHRNKKVSSVNLIWVDRPLCIVMCKKPRNEKYNCFKPNTAGFSQSQSMYLGH